MRKFEPWPSCKQIFASLDEFLLLRELDSGRYIVFVNGLPIHFDFQPRKFQPLIVVLQGAKTDAIIPPYIGGAGVTGELDCAHLFISDPSFYMDDRLNLAWYAGNLRIPLLQNVIEILTRKCMELSSSFRVVFSGGSGGGFASLVASKAFENSVAVVWNPQTDIEKYNEEHVEQYFASCWLGDRSRAKHTITTSVVDLYAKPGVENEVIYLQSLTDTWHVADHMEPFIAALSPESRVWTYVANWGEGHIPPSKELISRSLREAMSGDNSRYERILKFKRAQGAS